MRSSGLVLAQRRAAPEVGLELNSGGLPGLAHVLQRMLACAHQGMKCVGRHM